MFYYLKDDHANLKKNEAANDDDDDDDGGEASGVERTKHLDSFIDCYAFVSLLWEDHQKMLNVVTVDGEEKCKIFLSFVCSSVSF